MFRGYYASSWQISWQSVKPSPNYGDLWTCLTRRQSAILDLFCTCLNNPQTAFAGSYCYAKFGWIRRSIVSISWMFLHFASLAWKCLLTPPKISVLRDLTTKWRNICQWNPHSHTQAHSWGKDVTRHLAPQNWSTVVTCARYEETNKKAGIRWQDSAPRISGGTQGQRRTLIDGYLESPFSTACLL